MRLTLSRGFSLSSLQVGLSNTEAMKTSGIPGGGFFEKKQNTGNSISIFPLFIYNTIIIPLFNISS